MLKFEFDGHSSDEYGLIITEVSENDTLATRTLQIGEKNKYRVRENHFGAIYESNYSFKLGLMKNPCFVKDATPELQNGTLQFPNGYTPEISSGVLNFILCSADIKDEVLTFSTTDYLTSNDIRRVMAWLTSPQYPRLFKFIDSEYFSENIEFFVTFTEVETEHTYLPYSIEFTVTCDSPFGYTPLISHNITSSSTVTKNYSLDNTSDCHEDYIYPLIKVTPKSRGEIIIKNVTDNNGTLTVKALRNNPFYIDCKYLKIYDESKSLITFDDLGVKDIDDIYWPRLCYGTNTFEFKGDAEFEISYREYRKVGAFA